MKILYFASLKEALNIGKEDMQLTSSISVLKLRQLLMDKYQVEDFMGKILCAVNYESAGDDTIINNNDEVAFYPMVTGG